MTVLEDMNRNLNLALCIIFLLILGCEDGIEPLRTIPVIRTLELTNHDENGVTLNAEVIRRSTNETDVRYGFAISLNSFDLDDDLERIEYVDVPMDSSNYSYRLDSGLVTGLRYEIRAFAESSSERTAGSSVSFTSKSTSPNLGWKKVTPTFALKRSNAMIWLSTESSIYMLQIGTAIHRFDLNNSLITTLSAPLPFRLGSGADFIPLNGQPERIIGLSSEPKAFIELEGTEWNDLVPMERIVYARGSPYSFVLEKEKKWYAFSYWDDYWVVYDPEANSWNGGNYFDLNGLSIDWLDSGTYLSSNDRFYFLSNQNRLYSFDDVNNRVLLIRALNELEGTRNVEIFNHNNKIIVGPIQNEGFARGFALQWYFLSYDPIEETMERFGEFTTVRNVEQTYLMVQNGTLYFGIQREDRFLDIYSYDL